MRLSFVLPLALVACAPVVHVTHSPRPVPTTTPTTSTSVAPTTTTTSVAAPRPTTSVRRQDPAVNGPARALRASYTCAEAVAYLAANAAPGFRFVCPGYALGHQAMTCYRVPGVCPGDAVIVIAVACPASWENEANNSWVLAGYRKGTIDPYGYCR